MIIEDIAIMIADQLFDKAMRLLQDQTDRKKLRQKIIDAMQESLRDAFTSFPGLPPPGADFLDRTIVREELAKLISLSEQPSVHLLCQEWIKCYGKPSQGDLELVFGKFIENASDQLCSIEELASRLILRTVRQIQRKQLERDRLLDNGFYSSRDQLTEMTSVKSASEVQYDAKIDICRTLYLEQNPSAAQSQLRKLEAELHGKDVSNSLRSKLQTLIGVCALALGNPEEAIERFCRVYALQPDDPKVQANRALAHFFRGELQEAVDLAKKALSVQQDGTNARAVLVWSLAQMRGYKSLNDLVEPDHLHDTPYVRALGMVFLQAQEYALAEKYLKLCLAQDDADIQSKLLLCQTLVDRTIPDIEFGFSVSPLQRGNDVLRQALCYADQATEQARKTDNIALLHEALIIRSGIEGHLGDMRAAKADCDEILNQSRDDEKALFNRALISMNYGECEEALGFLERIPVERQGYPALICMARSYILTGKLDKAEACLEKLQGTGNDPFPLLIKGQLFIQQGVPDKAIAVRDRLAGQNDATGLVAAALIDHFLGDTQHQFQLLHKAYGMADSAHKEYCAAELAMVCFHQKRFPEAVQWFENAGKTAQPPILTRAYVKALHFSGQFEKAYTIAQAATSGGMTDSVLLDVQAAIAETLGNLQEAASLYEQLAKMQPGVAAHTINLLRCQYFLGDIEFVRNKLLQIREGTITDPMTCAQLAVILDLVGEYKRAIPLVYRALRNGREIPEIHLTYMQLFFNHENDMEGLNPVAISPDTAVLLRSGGNQQWMKVLASVPPLERWEYRVDSEVVQKLLGHRVGEVVTIREGEFGELRWEIVEIQSILVRALQESMSEFGTMFPSNTVIQRAEVADGDLTPLFRVVVASSVRAQQLLGSYEAGHLTMESLAQLIGHDRLEIQHGFYELGEHWMLCSSGSRSDQVKEAALIARSQSIVICPSALITLKDLGFLDKLTERFPEILVSQKLVNQFAIEVHTKKSWYGKDKHSLSYHNGRFCLSEVSQATMEREISDAEQLLAFVQGKCKVVPLDVRYSGVVTAGNGPSRLVGEVSLATMLVAEQTGAPLYCDDFTLRKLAWKASQVAGFWTYSLLQDLEARSLISREQFEDACIWLILSNHKYVPVNRAILLRGLERSDYCTDARVCKVFQTLAGPDIEEDSAITVAGDVLASIWQDPRMVATREFILQAVLRATVEGRLSPIVVDKLKSYLSRKLRLVPTLQDILGAIDDWYAIVAPTVTPRVLP